MRLRGAGGFRGLPNPVAPREACAIAADKSASSASLRLTVPYPRIEKTVRLSAADAADIGIRPKTPPVIPLASGSLPFVVSRMEFQLSGAAALLRVRGVTLCEDRPALSIAVPGSLRFMTESDDSARFVCRWPPRHRLHGPVARQDSPVKSVLRRPGEIEDTIAAANCPAVFAEAGYPLAAPRVELGRSACRTGSRNCLASDFPRSKATFPSAARGCISAGFSCAGFNPGKLPRRPCLASTSALFKCGAPRCDRW